MPASAAIAARVERRCASAGQADRYGRLLVACPDAALDLVASGHAMVFAVDAPAEKSDMYWCVSWSGMKGVRQSAADFKRCSPQVARLARTVDDLTPRLKGLALPTLLIWGRHDPTLSPEWYVRAASLLPNAKSQGLDAGHNPQLANFEEVWTLVIDFLETNFAA